MSSIKKTVDADSHVQQIGDLLATEYANLHPKAKIDVQRQNNVSIRIRIVDPDFKSMDRVDRDTALWKILDRLPDDVVSNVTMVLLLTPKETKASLANLEFENPMPSQL